MDAVFSALSHPVRRTLLDLLREQDGRTLTDLERHLTMTRFGVMKHLKVLEDAHVVVTRKVGREKLHYLNPAPIQQISDRWIPLRIAVRADNERSQDPTGKEGSANVSGCPEACLRAVHPSARGNGMGRDHK